MARSSLDSINHTLDLLVSNLLIEHSYPSPSPQKPNREEPPMSGQPAPEQPQQPQPGPRSLPRQPPVALPEHNGQSVSQFEALRASSVRQCARVNAELQAKLSQVTNDNARLKATIQQLSQASLAPAHTPQPTKSGWSEQMACEMQHVSTACDEMHMVAQMLLLRVDDIQLPRVSPPSAAAPQPATTLQPAAAPRPAAPQTAAPQPAAALQGSQPVVHELQSSAHTLRQRVAALSRSRLSLEELAALQELHLGLTELLTPSPVKAPPRIRCWICDEADSLEMLSVMCGCTDRRAHRTCLEEWIEMLDGNTLATRCAACNHQFRDSAQADTTLCDHSPSD